MNKEVEATDTITSMHTDADKNLTNEEWKNKGEHAFIGNYARFPVALIKGQGSRLWDADGKEYLDFLAGIAVCSLGHCHLGVSEAIARQAATLMHVSNLFYTVPQVRLAELLTEHSFADQVFFCNSGAEANEAAIKLARIHSPKERYEIISLTGSFHGRTLATVAATGQPKLHEGFEPMPQGFVHAEFGSLESLESLISEKTCAILCEPVQGESGVRPLPLDYIQGIKKLCDTHGLLLIFDEVQTGIGRTGKLFAYEHLAEQGIVPDIMTLAKGLGNGLPIGAMLTSEKIAASLVPGTHASTFGGNPVAAAGAVVVLETMLEEGFFTRVQETSTYFVEKLGSLVEKYPHIATGVRGKGLLLGLVLTEEARAKGAALVQAMFAQGVLINFAGNTVLRFVPPLVVSNEEIDSCIKRLDTVFSGFSSL